MRKRSWKGLRAIELVVVLSIVSVVLGVVVVRYDDFKCRAMQSEAKFFLQQIYAAQKHFHVEHDQYASLEQLVLEDKIVLLPQRYYTFSDGMVPTKDSFSVTATGVDGTLVAGELWSVNQHKDIKIDHSVCHK